MSFPVRRAFCRDPVYKPGRGIWLLLLWVLLALAMPAWAAAPMASAPAAAAPASAAAAAGTPSQNLIEVFVREGCPHCAAAEEFLAELARERPELDIRIRDVSKEPAAMERLLEIARERGGNAVVPATLVGGELIFGFSREASTDRLIRSALAGEKPPAGAGAVQGLSCTALEESTCRAEVESESAYELNFLGYSVNLETVGLPAFTIVMGLLDGLNPCSMWVLILMISLLATLNDRKRMFIIAGTFVLVEGIAYFVFMAAWLNLFLLIGMARWSQLLIAGLAIVAGMLCLKDFVMPGRGPSLSISDKAKPGIYARMRAILQAKSLQAAIVGVIVLALLVQVVEFLCTSGFPALFTRILTLRELDTASYYGYLLLYNLAYMFDDMIVLAIGVKTLSHRRLQEKEGRWLKLLSGVVMVGLGIYLIAT